MAKLHIVCPNCSTKYPVADDKLAGRKVTCKKCSQKFVAEIQGAAPPPPEDEFGLSPADDPFASSSSGSDPFGGDLFGDFSSSESAAAAPSLGALPAKQKSNSAGGFGVVPVLLGSARVVGVSVVVIIAFSSVFASPGTGQGSSPGNNVSGGPRGPGAPWNDRGFGPPQNQGGGRNGGAFAPPRNQGGANNEGIYVPPANGRNSPPPARPTFGESNSEPYELPGGRPFGGPADAARREAQETYERAMQDQRNPSRGMGGGPPADYRAEVERRWQETANREEQFLRDLYTRYGKENIVRLESREMSHEDAMALKDAIAPMMMAQSTRVTYDTAEQVRFIQFPYQGGVQAFARKITFGEVESVDVEKGRIRLKSYTIPK